MPPITMKRFIVLIVAPLTLAGFVGGLIIAGRLTLTQATQAEPVSQARPAPLPASGALPDLSSVAERALQVAANISSTQVYRTLNDPLARFFGGDPYVTQQATSLGSGVIVSSDGYVLTNNHVVGNAAAEIRVTLADGRERPGKVVGVDDVTDLAVVKVDAQGLQTLPWGDSGNLRVAEWVLAIGNPFQFSGTVTLGIVSTVSRSGAQVGAYSNFIQTDAAINPGNSGGALVNSRGELVGINSMIYSETGGYQGIGFAIPSNLARKIMDELVAHGEVRWGSVGEVAWETVDQATARRVGLSATGVYVDRIYTNSSAYLAGLRPEDLVVAFDGRPVTTAEQLNNAIIASTPGEKKKMDIVRGERRITLDVSIVKRTQQTRRR